MGGKLIIAGGSLEYSDKKIHKLLIEYAGGVGSKLAIVPTASGEDPVSTMNYVEELWLELGVSQENIIKLPVYGEEGSGWKQPADGDNDEIIKMLEGVTGFWFTGGDQYYTHKAFIRKDGSDTEALKLMRSIYENGGVIGGSSAGAAIMSEVMIASGDNMVALNAPTVYGYEDYDDSEDKQTNVRIVRGLGFFKEGIIDQHFDRRPRILRLIRTITDKNNDLTIGYGVSEDTAMIYDRDTQNITVAGLGALYIVDCSKIVKSNDNSTTFKDVVLHVMKEGDLYNHRDNVLQFMD